MRAEDAGYRRAKAVDECVQNLRRGPPCDVLERGRGEIVERGTGKVTRFDRVDDVYRLEVELPSEEVYGMEAAEGFSRRET